MKGTRAKDRQEPGGLAPLEPIDDWPEGYIGSFSGILGRFKRPAQGRIDRRAKLG